MKGKYLFAIVAMALAVYSCGKIGEEEPKEPVITQTTYRGLHVGEIIPIKGENLTGIEWMSSPHFVAEANTSQQIVPKHVGLAWLYDSNDKFRLVAEVTPKYTDYDLPIICKPEEYEGIPYALFTLFNSVGASHIKEYESRSLDPRSTNSLLLFKTGNPKSPHVFYQFDETTRLSICGSVLDPAYISNLPDFLTERYEVISVDVSKLSAYFEHKMGGTGDERIDYVGGLQYSSQIGGILLAFMLPSSTKATDFESTLSAFAEELSNTLNQ